MNSTTTTPTRAWACLQCGDVSFTPSENGKPCREAFRDLEGRTWPDCDGVLVPITVRRHEPLVCSACGCSYGAGGFDGCFKFAGGPCGDARCRCRAEDCYPAHTCRGELHPPRGRGRRGSR